MMKNCIYILTNKYNNVLYVGVTSNLQQRILQHRNGVFGGFTSKYNVTKVVFIEEHSDIRNAIEREKQIKSWSRKKKIALINEQNPEWIELMPIE
ncbi:MAG: GIY-YIG nuclease family protein [Alistipes sp.]|nr:GIY-YIG nuclease family protein [Alistipes sp.]